MVEEQEARRGAGSRRPVGYYYSEEGAATPRSKTVIEFASLPGEFATVGKLSCIPKPRSNIKLCPEKK
jgi:hypothetical protein